MTINLNPYLNFRDTTREAMSFYQSVFGGDLTLSTYAEMGQSDQPDEKDKIMHSQLVVDGRLSLMAADLPSSTAFDGNHAQIALSGGPEDESTLRGWWDRLSDGATVHEPLTTAPWGDAFGMLADRHGTTWMVNIAGASAGTDLGA